jgi:hypothetical protein
MVGPYHQHRRCKAARSVHYKAKTRSKGTVVIAAFCSGAVSCRHHTVIGLPRLFGKCLARKKEKGERLQKESKKTSLAEPQEINKV